MSAVRDLNPYFVADCSCGEPIIVSTFGSFIRMLAKHGDHPNKAFKKTDDGYTTLSVADMKIRKA